MARTFQYMADAHLSLIHISSVEAQSQGGSTIDPKVENPDIALPPAENSNDAEDTTVWDASTVEDKEQDGE